MAKNFGLGGLIADSFNTPAHTTAQASAPAAEPVSAPVAEQPKEEPTVSKEEKVETKESKSKVLSFQCEKGEQDDIKEYCFIKDIKITAFIVKAARAYMDKHKTSAGSIEPSERKKGASLMSVWMPEDLIKEIKVYSHYKKLTVTDFMRLAAMEYMKCNP